MKKIFFLFITILLLTLSSCIVQSEEKLIIELNPGVDTIEVGDIFIDAGVHSNYAYKTLYPTVLSSDVDNSTVGVYSIIYEISYLDYYKTVTRIVTVIDETPPSIALNPGLDTIIKGQEWVDAGVTVDDNTNHDVTLTITGSVNINQVGEYLITYQAIDENGNIATIFRYVTVIEV